jgi:epoxyqueuosine reductase
VLDATRCLSYLTIELKGAIPEPAREGIGAHVYGCDICQDVCPWNQLPGTGRTAAPEWQPRPGLDGPALVDLWRRSDEELAALVAGSTLTRPGLVGLRRNLAVALGNAGGPAARAALDAPIDAPSLADPLVAEHVGWARRRLAGAGTQESRDGS